MIALITSDEMGLALLSETCFCGVLHEAGLLSKLCRSDFEVFPLTVILLKTSLVGGFNPIIVGTRV